MNAWEKWKIRPQAVWLRKALFQVHLWTGIGAGIYILAMSLSGSALVFRRELSKALSREPRVLAGSGARLSEDALRQAAKRAHPEFEVTRVWLGKNPNQPSEIWLDRHGKKLQRLFDPYTGADLGDSLRPGFRFILWLVDLHDDLLLGKTGRVINGVGGIFTLVLAMTGAVIWWPGMDGWRRSLSFRWKQNPKGFNWTFHSALGFWSLGFLLMWAVSGIYLSFPGAFNAVVDFLEPSEPPRGSSRRGDQVLNWLAKAHFGRFAGIPVKVTWTVLGLVPLALFVTGSLMWWKRVLKPWLLRNTRAAKAIPGIGSAHAGSSVHLQQ